MFQNNLLMGAASAGGAVAAGSRRCVPVELRLPPSRSDVAGGDPVVSMVEPAVQRPGALVNPFIVD